MTDDQSKGAGEREGGMFDGSSGRRPSAEARRYVYRVLASSLDMDLKDPDGWVRGGIEKLADVRLAIEAARKIEAELRRKGNS